MAKFIQARVKVSAVISSASSALPESQFAKRYTSGEYATYNSSKVSMNGFYLIICRIGRKVTKSSIQSIHERTGTTQQRNHRMPKMPAPCCVARGSGARQTQSI